MSKHLKFPNQRTAKGMLDPGPTVDFARQVTREHLLYMKIVHGIVIGKDLVKDGYDPYTYKSPYGPKYEIDVKTLRSLCGVPVDYDKPVKGMKIGTVQHLCTCTFNRRPKQHHMKTCSQYRGTR